MAKLGLLFFPFAGYCDVVLLNMSKDILLIEDDAEIRELLSCLLEQEGFTVLSAKDGEQGEAMALESSFDVIVLDIMLPKKDGLEVLKTIRQQLSTPVMMLTAKGESLDRIIGFELGADDYLPKPFNPREFLARIKALIRRTELMDKTAPEPDEIRIDDLVIRPKRHEVLRDGTLLNLTSVEYKVLRVLTTRPNEVVSRADLTEEALGRKLSLYDRAIDMHLSNLRKKLDNGHIKTIRNAGVIYQVDSV